MVYNNEYIEIDTYPFSNTKAILEIELTSEKQQFTLPPFINVVCEVTNNEKFKNVNLAKTLSLEV